jgi:hypothetical protein
MVIELKEKNSVAQSGENKYKNWQFGLTICWSWSTRSFAVRMRKIVLITKRTMHILGPACFSLILGTCIAWNKPGLWNKHHSTLGRTITIQPILLKLDTVIHCSKCALLHRSTSAASVAGDKMWTKFTKASLNFHIVGRLVFRVRLPSITSYNVGSTFFLTAAGVVWSIVTQI